MFSRSDLKLSKTWCFSKMSCSFWISLLVVIVITLFSNWTSEVLKEIDNWRAPSISFSSAYFNIASFTSSLVMVFILFMIVDSSLIGFNFFGWTSMLGLISLRLKPDFIFNCSIEIIGLFAYFIWLSFSILVIGVGFFWIEAELFSNTFSKSSFFFPYRLIR